MPTPLLFGTPGFHIDGEKILEICLTGSFGFVLWFLGRRAQNARENADIRTPDQKNIDQLLGRVSSLEGQMTAANEKIEDLRSEKMHLEVQIVDLQKQIALLEIKKAEFENRETIFRTHLADLEERLAVKTEELRCAEAQLAALKGETQQKGETHVSH